MTPLCSTCRHRKVQSLGVDRHTWSYPRCDHPSVSQSDPIRARSSEGDCGPEGAFHEEVRILEVQAGG